METFQEVAPYWEAHTFIQNTRKYNTFAVTPAFEINPWKKECRSKRRFDGAFEQRIDFIFKFLFWEFGFYVTRKNYKSIRG